MLHDAMAVPDRGADRGAWPRRRVGRRAARAAGAALALWRGAAHGAGEVGDGLRGAHGDSQREKVGETIIISR